MDFFKGFEVSHPHMLKKLRNIFLASNYWAGSLDPRALWVRLRPKKCLFCQIYLLPGFWGKWVVSYLFKNRRTMLGLEF